MIALGLAAGLVAYNNLVNLWRPFHGALYVPLNLVVAGAVLAVGFGPGDLSRDRIGFDASGALPAAWIVGAFVVVLALAFRSRRGIALLADARLAGTSGARAAYVALVRIPLGTVVLEEVAFRGVLFGLWRPHGALVAALASSAAFGLWHVTPTWHLVRANRPQATWRPTSMAVAGGVLFTAAAGVFLSWLRESCGGLVAPFVVHAGLNSCASVAAVAAHRRLRRMS